MWIELARMASGFESRVFAFSEQVKPSKVPKFGSHVASINSKEGPRVSHDVARDLENMDLNFEELLLLAAHGRCN
jgi:hypothetical protein